jgi:hypothetical protein
MAGIWHTVPSMGFDIAHKPPFRVFCCLMAAFWAGMILLGTFRIACAAPPPVSQSTLSSASVPHAVCHCPMCASMGHAGMKCCCCHSGGTPFASCVCQCRPQPQTAATLAVLVWSPLAVLPGKQVSVLSSYRAWHYPALSSRLCTLSRLPLPRPPRLL